MQGQLPCLSGSPSASLAFFAMFQHFEGFREAVPGNCERPSSCYLEDAGLDPSDVFARTRRTRASQCDSFSVMIRKALDASPRQRLYIHEIYQWILDHYPHIRETGNEGWRNSVRHALSTSREFVRMKETKKAIYRGSEWCLASSDIGRWYRSLQQQQHQQQQQQHHHQLQPPKRQQRSRQDGGGDFNLTSEDDLLRMMAMANLIPDLCSTLTMQPDKPSPIDLSTYPSHMLGIVPNPDFFVFQRPNHYRYAQAKTKAASNLAPIAITWHVQQVGTAPSTPQNMKDPFLLASEESSSGFP